MQNFDWLLELPPNKALVYFIKHLEDVGYDDLSFMYQICKTRIKDLKARTNETAEIPGYEDLEVRWYESLRGSGQADYDIYDSDFYLAEAWACWVVYSRKYLLEIPKAKFLEPNGVKADMLPVNKIADLGCGIGYTTAAIKQIFPDAEVIGTNLPDTKQYEIAKSVGEVAGFEMVADVQSVGKADSIFASEYFEHFDKPIDHLIEVLENIQPQTLLIANAFTADAPGHFDYYEVNGKQLDGKATSRVFSQTLKAYGYEKVKTKFWNNRPNYWRLAK